MRLAWPVLTCWPVKTTTQYIIQLFGPQGGDANCPSNCTWRHYIDPCSGAADLALNKPFGLPSSLPDCEIRQDEFHNCQYSHTSVLQASLNYVQNAAWCKMILMSDAPEECNARLLFVFLLLSFLHFVDAVIVLNECSFSVSIMVWLHTLLTISAHSASFWL